MIVGGALKGDNLRNSVTIRGLWKSLIRMRQISELAIAFSKKLNRKRSEEGKLLKMTKVTLVLSKVRSFKAWQ